MSRREFLGVSKAAAAGAVVAAGLLGGVAGYLVSPPPTTVTTTIEKPVTKTVERTVQLGEAQATTTVTQTVTSTISPVTAPEGKKIKAGWVYVGPVGDFGWTYAHDQGRQYVAQLFPWLETITAESVAEPEAAGVIDRMVAEGAQVVFTTSFGYMDDTIEAGKKYPDVVFEHCSGYKRADNVGTYFAEFYQLYYLNGLAAGAVTKTNKLGYVAAHPIPEVIRHINAFVLGAREVNPKVEVHVVWLFSWYDPGKTREAATSLVEAQNVDVIAFTEDSPTTLQVAQEYQEQGKKVWSFSHYSDMSSYGPDAHLTGQIVNWGLLYEEILSRVYAGSWRSADYWWRIGDGMDYRWKLPPEERVLGEQKGAVYLAPVSPAVPEEIRGLMAQRYEEMKELLFEPFTGPIYDQDGNLRVEKGQRLGRDELWTMDWFVEGIVSKLPR